MVYAQPSTCPKKWHTQNPMWLWYTNGSPNLGQKTRPNNNKQQQTKKKKEKKIYKIVDFAVPADHRIKLKECGKRDKYPDLAIELKKLWNMKVTIIPIVIGAFGTMTIGLLGACRIWKLAAEWRPSKQQHDWKWPEYWEESWTLEEICCHSISSERPSALADVKNSNE